LSFVLFLFLHNALPLPSGPVYIKSSLRRSVIVVKKVK
jgi:hypothetical protein